MDTVNLFDFQPVFRIIHPLAKRMRGLPSPNTRLYETADDFISGKLGSVITEEIGNALWTLAHNAAKILVNQPEFDEPQQKALKAVAEFRDYMTTQGITLLTETDH